MFTTLARLTAKRTTGNTFASLSRRSYATNIDNDVVVIGGGPGGYVAAIKAGQLGLKTTCVEGRGSLGGTCLNVGCIPSKALLHSSHMLEMANHEFEKHGIIAKDVSFDLSKMMKQKTDSVGGLTKGIEGLFKKNKVEYARGWGKITGPNEVTVTGQNGETTKLNAKNIIIATGSEPIPLPFLPFDEKTIVSSTGALSLDKVPAHLVVIGGGVIGLELGSVWKRLGAKVTVVELFDRISPFLDVEVGKYFLTSLKKQGIEFKLSTKLLGGKVLPEGGAVLNVESVTDGVKEEIKADAVLVSIGRRPYTLNLGLKEIGVEVDNKGRIKTNSQFKTNISSIFAIGDAIAGPMLAHKAEEEGIACAEHIAGLAGHVNYDAIPNVIYTHPEVASCGKTEEELKAAGVQYKVGKFMYKANSRARTNADDEGLVKIIADKETDRVLGIHIIGPNAGEQIAEGVLAMEYGASSEDIGRTCHAHPTLSEAFKEAAMAVYDKPIHS